MALNSINTNISAYYAQQNIGKASTSASLSVARLSSGSRIVRASDDVAALAAGTSLRTAVTTLRQALINTSQGASMLQVADGALSQIVDILQRQKAIAIQSGAGSLGATERSFLNQEFQQLADEINRLTGTTNFNGVVLLDGSVFDRTTPETATQNAGQASGSIQILTQQNSKNIIFNGATFVGTTVSVNSYNYLNGNSVVEQLDNLVTTLNASTDTRVAGATYTRVGNSLVITQDAGGGALGRTFTFDINTYGAANVAVAGTTTGAVATRYYLQGGDEIGLGLGRTVSSGTIGDNLVVTQGQIAANNVLSFSPGVLNAFTASFLGKGITFADGANMSFNFTTGIATTTDILIGATVEETLDNAVQTLRTFSGLATTNNDRRYIFDQFEFNREGRQITVQRKDVGNLTNVAGVAVTVITSVTGAGPQVATNFSNGQRQGVTTSGVANADFVGAISGFEAAYTNNVNRINLSITVGSVTYSAFNVDTAPTANTTVRFGSVDGGYFDVDFAANQGAAVTDEATADTIAARLDAAFAGLTFYQKRDIESYVGAGSILTNGSITGTLTGTKVRLSNSDFSDLNLESINVQAPSPGTANGIIEMVINGETYRTAEIGSEISPNGLIKLTSLTNANHFVEFFGPTTTSNNPASAQSIFFSTSDQAQALEDALEAAFGIGEAGTALTFQVGTTTEDSLSVSIGNASTDKIYGGQAIDVLTQTSAATASDVLDDAINAVTSIRADVGALQSRFNYASFNIESSLQNQDAARGVLLDTDVAAESTAYATAQVQLQAGIAVLAQANLLPQNLLKLIG